MATITGLTADRMLEIEAASVIDGDVVGDDLILTTKGGSQINAGNVRGPQGVAGPVGSDLSVVTAKNILDVGMSGQIRAGRQLTATDFTNMGLAAPLGLWNLSNLNDSSGNGRNLSNKGAVPFAAGIEGVASSAAQFAGSTAQALYINDTGASDPFRIKTGTVGCWFKTAKKGVSQALVGKRGPSDGSFCYWLQISSGNVLGFEMASQGNAVTSVASLGVFDVCDNRWHFGVGVCDGSMLYIYVDGVLEKIQPSNGPLFSANAVLNIGGLHADASTATTNSHFGLIDEAFITADVLSADQIRNLYCVKIPHTLSAIPKNVGLNVRRRKKGAALSASDFPTQPLRLYNFSAGSLNDEGSNGQVLTNNGGVLSVAGVDGSPENAMNFNTLASQSLSSTDAGLPSGLTARSYGFWVKQGTLQSNPPIFAWGSHVTQSYLAHAIFVNASGQVVSRPLNDTGNDLIGPFITDGKWHFVVMTEDNSAVDGVKRKMYFDGCFAVGSGVMANLTLAGANRFRLANWPDGSGSVNQTFHGQLDGVFICGYVLNATQIATLYAKGSQVLGVSPKNPGDHVELMTNTDLFCLFDTLETQHQIDLVVR